MPTFTHTPKTYARIGAALALSLGLVLASATASGAAGPDRDTLHVDLSRPGAVASSNVTTLGLLPGWKLPSGTSNFGEVIANQEFRIGNGKSPYFTHAGYFTPPIGLTAGETGFGDVNTFDASLTIGSGEHGYQEGMSVAISLDSPSQSGSRYGGTLFFLHQDNVLKIGTFYPEASKNTGTRPVASNAIVWTEAFFAEVDPAVKHTVRTVAKFNDGPANDVLEFYVDGTLVYTGSTWEGYAEIKAQAPSAVGSLHFFSGSNTTSSIGLSVIPTITAQPSLSTKGFLFSNISYSSYDILPVPPVTTVPPVIAPAPEPTPNGDLDLPPATDLGNTVDVVGTGFEPFELVHFTWYSTPTFAGWAQADAFGVVRATFSVPANLAPGSTHTLQAVGASSGWVVNARTTIALAATGSDNVLPLALMAGSLLAVGAGALALVGLSRRRTV